MNVGENVEKVDSGVFSKFDRIAFCSVHTTAGFLEQPLALKLGNTREGIESLVRSARRLFPEGAPYWHDRMELRSELTAEQRKHEPLNADSHLAFICLGLCNCVLYKFAPDHPVYFIDLDGESNQTFRSRKSIAVGYNNATCVHEETLKVDLPKKNQCAVDLNNSLPDLQALVAKYQIHRGLVTLELAPGEKHAGVTVNEFESLLVERDITDVLMNPLRYTLSNAPRFARNPLRVPGKAKNMLQYEIHLAIRDGLRVANRSVSILEYMVERLGMHLPLLEHIIDRIASPLEARWMNLGSSIRMLINAKDEDPLGRVMVGTYQSPILIQWRRPESDVREMHLRLLRFT